jgi:hypothetical protein
MDPNKKEREEEKKLKKEVKASKRAWRKIRKERFRFLDGTNASAATPKNGGKEVTDSTSPAN